MTSKKAFGIDATRRRAATGSGRKLRQLTRVCLGIILSMSILIGGFSLFTDWYCISYPPKLKGTPAIVKTALVNGAHGVKCIGNSWICRKDGIIRMYLSGDPFSLGYSNAKLTQHFIKEQEQNLLNTVRQQVPSPVKLWLLKKYIFWRNRSLPRFVVPDYQMEIYGLSRGYDDPFPEIAPLYHRLLNYHAAHDISHAVMDNPLVGCTSFAAWGKMTPQGHLLVGRNFDFNSGDSFDINKIVMRVKPSEGIGYISVAWAGMIGVVSGINEAGISVTINAAHSSQEQRVGTPASLVMRDVMQHSATLEDAVDIIKRSDVFVSDAYLVADGRLGVAVVVEKTPGKCAVRTTKGEYIVCSNHFLTPDLRDDPANLKYMSEGTSVDRYKQMDLLVRRHAGNLTVQTAAEILRNSEVPVGIAGGYGNAASINPLIATHSVIIDVTDRIIWVSRYPHQLGSYVPFGMDDFQNPSGAEVVKEDPMLENGSYARYLRAKDYLSRAYQSFKKASLDDAWQAARKAEVLNPDLYEIQLLLGKIALRAGRKTQAAVLLRQAIEHYPAYLSEREEIQKLLDQIEQPN